MMKRWKLAWGNQRGFTLIELAVAVFVISMLIAISLPHLRGTGEKAQKTACEGNQRLLRAQLENYYLTEKGYPTGTTDAERLDKMMELKYLQTRPACPSGGMYEITVSADQTSATVECSVHGVLGE
jgi:prepilin-type N-terminal cleavage/methylation domain-containing protein